MVQQTIILREEPLSLERRLLVRRRATGDLTGSRPDKFRSATYRLGGVALGGKNTFVSCPMARIKPGSLLADVCKRPRYFRCDEAVLASATERPDYACAR